MHSGNQPSGEVNYNPYTHYNVNQPTNPINRININYGYNSIKNEQPFRLDRNTRF